MLYVKRLALGRGTGERQAWRVNRGILLDTVELDHMNPYRLSHSGPINLQTIRIITCRLGPVTWISDRPTFDRVHQLLQEALYRMQTLR